MNYCSIDDAWKNSDNLTDQFKLKKKTLETFSSDDEQPPKNTIKIDDQEYYNDFNYENNFNYNLDNSLFNEINKETEKKMNPPLEKDNGNKENLKTKTNNYHNVFICDDFFDHLETCKICRMKMRKRFKSNILEKFDNLVIDNKDTILIFLIILFALIFCNLLINIFK
jgi:hypothetical protein